MEPNRMIGALLMLVVVIAYVGIAILIGWLIYKAIIGIIREVKKKD